MKYNRNPNTTCSICKSPCYKRPSDLLKSSGKAYCSQTCYGISCRKETPCLVCKTPIISSLNKKTCSKKCFEKLLSSPDRTFSKGRKKVTSTPKFRTRSLRKLMFSLRGSKCEICNYNKEQVLTIHHIIERSKGGSDDPSNLLVLCRNCHGEIHANLLQYP